MAAINFTIAVPDDWWVDSWSNNDTLSFTYPDGAPATFQWIKHEGEGRFEAYIDSDNLKEETNLGDGEVLETLNASDYPAVATWLHIKTTDHTFDDVTMGDGSVYKKINNPILRDLFEIDDSGGKPTLRAVYKQITSVIENKVKTRKQYVNAYNSTYDFSSDIQTKIDAYITAADSFATMMAPVGPWMLDSHNDHAGKFASPKIPTDLITAFSALPKPDGTPDLT